MLQRLSLIGNDSCSHVCEPPSAKSATAWPLPFKTHFVVRSPSTPTGPLACILDVEIPTFYKIMIKHILEIVCNFYMSSQNLPQHQDQI